MFTFLQCVLKPQKCVLKMPKKLQFEIGHCASVAVKNFSMVTATILQVYKGIKSWFKVFHLHLSVPHMMCEDLPSLPFLVTLAQIWLLMVSLCKEALLEFSKAQASVPGASNKLGE